ncbi:MAG: amidohydrolase family protein [Thermodesulfobacteriota bacterium]
MEQHILCDRCFDGEKYLSGPLSILIRDGRIADVGPAGEEILSLAGRRDASGRPVLDLRGALVMPGLINTHTHIVRGGMFRVDEPFSVGQAVANLCTCLAAGVTTVGDMGCTAGLITALRDHLARRPGAGPSIVCCGPMLTTPGGYPLDWMPRTYELLGTAVAMRNAEDARKAVRRLCSQGVDHIKLSVMHRSYADRPLPALPVPVARAAVEAAHAAGKKALSHAHSIGDYEVSLDAGADALMHSSFELISPDLAKRVRDAGIPVCPTLWCFSGVLAGVEKRLDRNPAYTGLVAPAISRDWEKFCEGFLSSGDLIPPGTAAAGLPKARAREGVENAEKNLALLVRHGVPIAFGNDGAYGFCLPGRPVDELLAMERAGMATEDVLAAATKNAAELLGLNDRGRIAKGLRADILAVSPETEKSVAGIEKVRAVFHAGLRVEPPRAGDRTRTALAILGGFAKTLVWAIGR